MDWVLANATFILVLSGIIAFLMAAGMGSNDVANVMGTSVGSKALTIKQAIVVAIIFEFAGAYLAGGGVTQTISKGIVNPDAFADPRILIYGMMASLSAAAVWLITASTFKLPVSTTHTIVGAIVGFAIISVGAEVVDWPSVGRIAFSWILSPFLGALFAFALLRFTQRNILDTEHSFARTKIFVPICIGYCGFLIAAVIFLSGLHHLGIDFSTPQALAFALLVGLAVGFIGSRLIRPISFKPEDNKSFRYASVEKVFAVLMIFTACTMAFAHGSSDVSNAIGPLVAIESLIRNGLIPAATLIIPKWILFIGALGIIVGLSIFGARVMSTIGTKITQLTPSKGFAAEMAAATIVVTAAGVGIPISTTHTLVGAVLGVGLAKGVSNIDLRVLGTIFASWVITLPAGAILSIAFFFLFKSLMG